MNININNNVVVLHKLIPWSLIIVRASTHLYSIGLSHYKPLNATNRELIDRPLFTIIFLTINVIKQIVLILLPEQNNNIYAIMGDLAYYFGKNISKYFDILFIVCFILVLLSQLLNFYNYIYGIKPRDLNIFS